MSFIRVGRWIGWWKMWVGKGIVNSDLIQDSYQSGGGWGQQPASSKTFSDDPQGILLFFSFPCPIIRYILRRIQEASAWQRGRHTRCWPYRHRAQCRWCSWDCPHEWWVAHLHPDPNATQGCWASGILVKQVLRGDIARLERCTEITTGGLTSGSSGIPVKRSKPFKYAYEKEIVMYACTSYLNHHLPRLYLTGAYLSPGNKTNCAALIQDWCSNRMGTHRFQEARLFFDRMYLFAGSLSWPCPSAGQRSGTNSPIFDPWYYI